VIKKAWPLDTLDSDQGDQGDQGLDHLGHLGLPMMEKVYSFRTRLPYGSCSTHHRFLLIVTLVHRTSAKVP